jgi:hypothetical protein
MEPSAETFQPSRLYSRTGWAALAGSLVCVVCGLRAPMAFIPGLLCAGTSVALFWLAARPAIGIFADRFTVGERAIAWREVREINSSFTSPLVLKVRLTNTRRKLLVFPGDPEHIARLMYQLRKNSYLATFDGVAYRDYWTWSTLTGSDREECGFEHPVHMVSPEDEQEVERMYQRLKSVGRLDSSGDGSSKSDEE